MKKAFPTVDAFGSLSVIVPLLNEVRAFRHTIERLMESHSVIIREVLVVVCQRTSSESLREYWSMQCKYPLHLVLLHQKRPKLGGALLEGIEASRGTHTLIMFSDLESDPSDVCALVAMARHHPRAIVSASRWLDGGVFVGYNPCKLVLNYFLQMYLGALFASQITDFSFGFRIYPTAVLNAFSWRQLDHSFVIESLLIPVLGGVSVVEVPATWQRRSEGAGQSGFRAYWSYIGVSLSIRLAGVARENLRSGDQQG